MADRKAILTAWVPSWTILGNEQFAQVPARMTEAIRSGGAQLYYMFTVYVLRDEYEKIYKGVTNNIQRRLVEHRSGHTKTTSKMSNLKLVYKEQYATFEEARRRELYLKSAAGRRFLKNNMLR